MYKYVGKNTLSVKEQLNGFDCNWYTFKHGDVVPDSVVGLLRKNGGKIEKDKDDVVESKKEPVEKQSEDFKPVKKKVVKKKKRKKK